MDVTIKERANGGANIEVGFAGDAAGLEEVRRFAKQDGVTPQRWIQNAVKNAIRVFVEQQAAAGVNV